MSYKPAVEMELENYSTKPKMVSQTCAWNLFSSMASSVPRTPVCGPLRTMTLPPGLGNTVSSCD